jgi:hypothetical protein
VVQSGSGSVRLSPGQIIFNGGGNIQQIGDTQYFRAGMSGSSSYHFDNYYGGFPHELFFIDTNGNIRAAGDAKITGITTTARLNVETGGLSVSGISSFTGPIYEGVTNSFNTSLTPSSGTLTISTLNSSVIVGALTTSVTTWAFTGVNTTNGRATTLSIIIDSNSLYTYGDNSSVNGIGVSNGVRWAGGLAPTATNNEDILSFTIVTDNSGTIRVYGSSALNYS